MKNNYLPQKVTIEKLKKYTSEVNLYTLKPVNGNGIEFSPGQFILLSIFGYEEAAFGIASSPFENERFNICVHNVGNLTNELDTLKAGTEVGVRGPYGNGFPLDALKGKDLIMAAGGTGIAPIASLVEYCIARPEEFNNIKLLYGVKSPTDLLFSDQLKRWGSHLDLRLIVEKPDREWKQPVGLITKLCTTLEIKSPDTQVVMCGPPIMYRYMVQEIAELGVDHDRIHLSLERRMRCGIGKCQHCSFDGGYVCVDGPVFNCQDIYELIMEG